MVSPSSIPLQRQPSQRQLSRPTMSRPGHRRASLIFQDPIPATNGAPSKRYSAGDSSDDEVPEPKFSASVKALLDEDGLGSSPHRRENWKEENPMSRRLFTSANSGEKPSRTASPQNQSTGSPAPRIVRIRTGSSSSRSRMEGSVPSSNEKSDSDSRNPRNDLITPGPRVRTVRLSGSRNDAQSPPSTSSQRRSAERRNSLEEKERAISSDEKKSSRVRSVRLSGSHNDAQSPLSTSSSQVRSAERRNSLEEKERAVSSDERKSPRVRSVHLSGSRRNAQSAPPRRSEERRNSLEEKQSAVSSDEKKSLRVSSVRLNGSYRDAQSPPSTSPPPKRSEERRNSYRNEYAGLPDERKPRFDDEYVPRVGVASSVLRSRPGDEPGAHSSLRVKRVGRLTGTFLNGPARRGVLRRQSEENSDENEYAGNEAREIDGDTNANSEEKHAPKPSKVSWADPSPPNVVNRHHGIESAAADGPFSRPSSPRSYGSQSKSTPASSEVSSRSSGPREQPAFKVPSLPPLPSVRDQENEPPPTFKKSKPRGFNLLDKPEKLSVMYGDEKKEQPAEAPASHSPRKPLSTRSNNTPHRPAPAPPKMSVLETATASGGAATASQSRRKRNQISVNGKIFTKLDCIGRGGSSRVYRVMAENYKIFALKRVSLENLDPLTLAGYKGEIDLLKKLGDLDRVVRLFDFELNHEKKVLSVLMEMGESDLEKMLTYRLNADGATFDPTYTRYYWKEMLECVQAVHNHNIVHSDLKPANFLMTQGRLKLIDFGIANAIQDNTVNVHREQQVGTPNYMSPEALVDSNASIGLPASVGKMMKLGKRSDVWSLGCILYKMVYGQPPFAKIAKYYERIMAIPNPNFPINFPAYGVGGVPVPEGLLETMKACLQRDQTLRPTVDQLLDSRDPFLYPDTEYQGAIPMTPEMFDKVLENVMQHCRSRGVPSEEGLRQVSTGFYERLQKAWKEEKAKRQHAGV